MKKLFLAILLLCVTSPVFGAIAGGEYTIGPGQTYSDMDDFRDNGLALGLLGDTTGWINATYTETSTVEWDLHTGTTFQLFIDVKPEFRNTTGIYDGTKSSWVVAGLQNQLGTDNHIHFSNIQAAVTSGSDIFAYSNVSIGTATFKNIIFQGDNTNTGQVFLQTGTGMSNGYFKITNCIGNKLRKNSGAFCNVTNDNIGTVNIDLFNVTISSANYGFRTRNNAVVNAINCSITDVTDSYRLEDGASVITYCIADDAQAGLGNIKIDNGLADWSSMFNDFTNSDFNIKDTASLLYSTGTAIASVTTDLIGTARTTDSLGALEYIASPVVPPVDVFSGRALSSTSIDFYWIDKSTETGYIVKTSVGATLDTLTADTTFYVETGLTRSTSYSRYVIAVYGVLESSASPTATVATNIDPQTFWTDGSVIDDSGDGSVGSPKKYIGTGIDVLSGGDTLMIKDGIYKGVENKINDIPNGIGKYYTTVRAENDFGVTIASQTVTGTASTAIIYLNGASSITIKGFLIKESTGTSINDTDAIYISDSDHIKIQKIGVKNGASTSSEYGGPVRLADSSYCLIEDVFACGRMRYGIVIRGGENSHHNVARRCVVRWDFGKTAQPRAGIAIYGGNDGTTTNSHVYLQNCITVDGVFVSTGNFTGGFSSPHETSFTDRYGCISLNNGGYGFHMSEDNLCNNITANHCVSWDNTAANAMFWRSLTADAQNSGAYNCSVYNGQIEGDITYSAKFSSSIYCGNTVIDATITDDVSVSQSTNTFTYITQSPTANKGATIVYEMGTTGTLYGETGWNTLTATDIFPFRNEDNIKVLFSEPNAPTIGCEPQVNITKSGFCTEGKQLDGTSDVTLSSYIQEYLGNQYTPTPTPSTETQKVRFLQDSGYKIIKY